MSGTSQLQTILDHIDADFDNSLNRLFALAPAIRCLTGPDTKVVGPACTVKVHPADNLMVHASLDVAQPGDVVVIDAGGTSTNATLGNLVCAKAQHRGIAAFVIDGIVTGLFFLPAYIALLAGPTEIESCSLDQAKTGGSSQSQSRARAPAQPVRSRMPLLTVVPPV